MQLNSGRPPGTMPARSRQQQSNGRILQPSLTETSLNMSGILGKKSGRPPAVNAKMHTKGQVRLHIAHPNKRQEESQEPEPGPESPTVDLAGSFNRVPAPEKRQVLALSVLCVLMIGMYMFYYISGPHQYHSDTLSTMVSAAPATSPKPDPQPHTPERGGHHHIDKCVSEIADDLWEHREPIWHQCTVWAANQSRVRLMRMKDKAVSVVSETTAREVHFKTDLIAPDLYLRTPAGVRAAPQNYANLVHGKEDRETNLLEVSAKLRPTEEETAALEAPEIPEGSVSVAKTMALLTDEVIFLKKTVQTLQQRVENLQDALIAVA